MDLWNTPQSKMLACLSKFTGQEWPGQEPTYRAQEPGRHLEPEPGPESPLQTTEEQSGPHQGQVRALKPGSAAAGLQSAAVHPFPV